MEMENNQPSKWCWSHWPSNILTLLGQLKWRWFQPERYIGNNLPFNSIRAFKLKIMTVERSWIAINASDLIVFLSAVRLNFPLHSQFCSFFCARKNSRAEETNNIFGCWFLLTVFNSFRHAKYRISEREREKTLTNLQNVIADKRNLWQNIQLTPFFINKFFFLPAVCILILLCIPKIRLIFVRILFFTLSSHRSLLPLQMQYRSMWSVCNSGHVFWYARLPDSCLCIRVYSTITIRAERTTERERER